jgi:hypothetical protein
MSQRISVRIENLNARQAFYGYTGRPGRFSGA